MNRIVVIGSPGSGKSVLARHLGQRTRLPVFHLDSLFWRPGWVETPAEEWKARQADLVAGDRWIIDGNYTETLDIRLPAADTIVFLDFPRRTCVRGILVRELTPTGRRRPDLAEGCPPKYDREFFRFVWSFRAAERPRVLDAIAVTPRAAPSTGSARAGPAPVPRPAQAGVRVDSALASTTARSSMPDTPMPDAR